MSLDEFKTIYWWEWAHRFLGRFIGVVFFVPFVVFWLLGFIPKALLPRLLGLFALGGVQGAVGWYMVKSGLVDRLDVSQYRLAAHLGIAVIILGYTLWLLFGLGHEQKRGARLSGTCARVDRRRRPGPDLSANPRRRAGRRARRRHRLQYVAADQRVLHPRGPRRLRALVHQPVREQAHGAVRPPHAGLCRGRRHACPGGLARLQASAVGADRKRLRRGLFRTAASDARRLDPAARGADPARARAPGGRHGAIRRRALSPLADARAAQPRHQGFTPRRAPDRGRR